MDWVEDSGDSARVSPFAETASAPAGGASAPSPRVPVRTEPCGRSLMPVSRSPAAAAAYSGPARGSAGARRAGHTELRTVRTRDAVEEPARPGSGPSSLLRLGGGLVVVRRTR